MDTVKRWLYSSSSFIPIAIVAIIGEALLNLIIIRRIPYTEIDWVAYMQESAGFMHGDWDYLNLKGDTGPCVYPAGFLYVFSVLRMVTQNGSNILLGQYMFAAFYLLLMIVLLWLYYKVIMDNNHESLVGAPKQSNRNYYLPAFWTIFLLCASRRIHSIFVLRLFNDGIAMIFVYLAILAFVYDFWTSGTILFSIALSIKMNILLFLPGLLVLYVKRFGFVRSFAQIFILVLVQVILAIPFLYTNAPGYMERAFNFGREFTFIWTVNYKFLPEDVFVSKALARGLLLGHVLTLLFFGFFRWTKEEGGPFRLILFGGNEQTKGRQMTAQHIVKTLFESNLIGIIFARSLHFQFYVWYYHQLPLLLFSMTKVPLWLKLAIMAGIEIIWNIFPSNSVTSICLTVMHIVLLIGLAFGQPLYSAYRQKATPKAKVN